MQKVTVGDIEMAYRVYGKGYPIVMIMGSSGTQDDWDPNVIKRLAASYKVITFDNRGMGFSTAGTMEFTIPQFANDTAGFMSAINIARAHVLGWSMGTNIAEELVLGQPEKVDKLILYAADCGGPQYVQPSVEVMQQLNDTSGNLIEKAQRMLPLLFPPEWFAIQENVSYVMKALSSSTEPMPEESVIKQDQAINTWSGTYDRLPGIKSPTLLITGTEDVLTPPQNSLIMVDRIPKAWLSQLRGGGHGVQFQYPEQFANIVLNFLSAP